MANALEKKIGPLPAWAWMAGVTLGIFLYWRSRQNATGTSATAASDPNAVDPSTGLTYGQEAGGLGFGTGAGSDTGGSSTGGGAGTITPTVTGGANPTPTTTPTDNTDPLAAFLSGLQEYGAIRTALESAGVGGPVTNIYEVTGTPAKKQPTPVKPVSSGKPVKQPVTTGKGKSKPKGRRTPAKHHTGSKAASVPSGQRAPAHPHEQHHATTPSHVREHPAHTRVTVKTAKPPSPRRHR